MATLLKGLGCIAFFLFVVLAAALGSTEASWQGFDRSFHRPDQQPQPQSQPTQPAPRGTLTVEALKISQSSRSFTDIDVRFTNTSTQALDWWIVGVEAYDKDGNYLGRGDGLVTDIAPGQSQVHAVRIKTQANAINTWQVTLNTVRGYGSLENLVRFYRLDVKVRQPTAPTKKTKA